METITEYRKRLHDMGIKRLGSGLFSTVYQHPTLQNMVVKMIVRNDPMYIEYAQKCSRLDNPWLPKIYGIEYAKVLKRGKEITVAFVFLERLKRASRVEQQQAAEKITGNDYDWCGLYPHWDSFNWRLISANHKDENVKTVARLFDAIDVNDIHEENVMMREDQLVFTDPVASETS